MKSAQELAQSLGVNEATLRLWRAEAGIGAKARNVGYSADEEARIREIAANKRKSKPRKKDMRAEVPLISAESQKYAPLSADSPSVDSANDSAYFSATDANTRYWGRSDLFEDSVIARLERLEGMIQALHALLERAAIAPRYVARKAVDDALDEPPRRAYTKRETRPQRANGMRLTRFAALHDVPPRTAREQASGAKPKYAVTVIGTNGNSEYYVEPAQAAGVVAFWQRTGYPYTKCPDCPHTQEAQE